MRRLAVTILITFTLLCACTGANRTPGDSATPTTAPTKTPPSPHIVYLNGRDVWIADPDGENARALTQGSIGAGYAGSVSHDGEVDVYYTSQIDGDNSGGTFIVLRQPVAGGASEELFTFHGGQKNAEFFSENASVSPDGRHVAYSDERGLARYDVETKSDRLLLSNIPCDIRSASGCKGYFFPSYAPTGSALAATKIFFEGSTGILVDDSVLPATEHDMDFDMSGWCPDSTKLCGLDRGGEYNNGVTILSRDLLPMENLTEGLGPSVSIGSCVWNPAGELAFTYSLRPDLPSEERHIVSYDASLRRVADRVIDVAGYVDVFAWLPATGEFIVSDRRRDDAYSYRNRILHGDGTLTDFPIGGRLLGVTR